MNRLWLWYFPFLFLPNLGFASETGFGTLTFADFLIGPYIILLSFSVKWGTRLNVGRITLIMMIFLWWAVLSTVTIPFRYEEQTDYFVTFGMLKIAKLCLYAVAGILTARSLTKEDTREAFKWSLLGAAVVNGVALWSTQVGALAETDSGYSATNGISVMAALLVCYIGALLVTNQGSQKWQMAAPYVLTILVAGSAVSDGRGGWLAAIAGALYIAWRVGTRGKVVRYALLGVLVIGILYQSIPEFAEQVDKSFFAPETTSGYQGTRNVGTLDDGGRFRGWSNEGAQFIRAPVLGTGVFHRGADTGLHATGSHNYWLQIYLETGIIGGTLVVAMVVIAWKQGTRQAAESNFADVPLKAALVAALVGGFGGEYFYGGIILFTLLAVYAPTGGRPITKRRLFIPQDSRNHHKDLSDPRNHMVGRLSESTLGVSMPVR